MGAKLWSSDINLNVFGSRADTARCTGIFQPSIDSRLAVKICKSIQYVKMHVSWRRLFYILILKYTFAPKCIATDLRFTIVGIEVL